MEKKVTVYSLAEELGVSVAAISRAFDPGSRLKKEKRELILETAKKYGYTPNRMASRLSMDAIRIGVLNFSYLKVYYTEVLDGINAAYLDLRDYKVECDLRVFQRGENTKEEALAVLDEFAEKKYDGVIVCGIYEDWVVEKINALADAGIRVATVQYDIPESRRLFASLSNYPVIGEMAAQLCGMLLRGAETREAVMFTGNRRSPNHRQLVESFRRASVPNGFDVVDIYDTRDDAECAEQMVELAFAEHPRIGAVYASSANSLPICRYLERKGLGQKIAFVASDVFEELYPFVERRTIDATIYQEPYKMGYEAFARLYHVLADGEETEGVLYSTPRVVMSSNLFDFR